MGVCGFCVVVHHAAPGLARATWYQPYNNCQPLYGPALRASTVENRLQRSTPLWLGLQGLCTKAHLPRLCTTFHVNSWTTP